MPIFVQSSPVMFYRPRSRNPISKRHADTINISEALSEMLKDSGWEKKYNFIRVIKAWPELMGETVAKRTDSIFVKDKILFVKLSSAPLKSELSMSKELIKERIHEMLGESLLIDIRFL